jgi:CRP-like cAMP-binding protein
MVQPKIASVTQPYLLRNEFGLSDFPFKDTGLSLPTARFEARKRGDTLFQQDTFPKGAFWLQTGKVKIFQVTPSGQRQTLYIYSDGDLIGFRQVLAGEANPVSAVVLENSVLGFIPTDTFFGLLEASPLFARKVMTSLAREFSVWMNRMTAFAQLPVRRRLMLALLVLHEQYRRSGSPPGLITMTRAELAEYIGASPETVIRAMHALKTAGMVRISGRRIVLPDAEGLVRIFEEEGL